MPPAALPATGRARARRALTGLLLTAAVAGAVAGLSPTRPQSGPPQQALPPQAPHQQAPQQQVPQQQVPQQRVSGPSAAPDAAAGAAAGRVLPPADRLRAVDALLARRAAAVRARDGEAFLATVDPQAGAFRVRQAALAAALATVPLADWSYTVDPVAGAAPVAVARGDRWGSRVVVSYRLQGVDDTPVQAAQYLTFVSRPDGWYVAADDEPGLGGSTERAVWDEGPVVAVRGQRSLVLAHPGTPGLRDIAAELDAAVPRVRAAWGGDWEQRVAAVVPADRAELARLLPGTGDLTTVAALAVMGRGPVGPRILVNPEAFPRLSAAGRRVVLTHELTHVATRAATGPMVPTWLVEGLADEVGYRGAGVPEREAAAELQADVRGGRLPDRLPQTADFRGGAAPQAYEQAWLAVEYLRRRYGLPGVLDLYRRLGAEPAGEPAAALDSALRRELGVGTADLTAAWRAQLVERLS